MSEGVNTKRIVKVASELGVGVEHIIDFLHQKGYADIGRNSKVSEDIYSILLKEFQAEKIIKDESKLVGISVKQKKETVTISDEFKAEPKKPGEQDEILIKDAQGGLSSEDLIRAKPADIHVKVISKIDLDTIPAKKKEEEKVKKPKPVEKKPEPPPAEPEKKAEKPEPEKKQEDFLETKIEKLEGPTIVGKINLPPKEEKKKPVASSSADFQTDRDKSKKKRKRIRRGAIDTAGDFKEGGGPGQKDKGKTRLPARGKKTEEKELPSEEEIQAQIKETLARLSGTGKSKAAKYRRLKRE
jgi:translation initiation factor IF-2